MPEAASEKMTSGGIWKAAMTATDGLPPSTKSCCSAKEVMAKVEVPFSTVSRAGVPGPPSRMVTSSPSRS